jgi:molybdopterin-containing oxidoreductase family membrane subunit
MFWLTGLIPDLSFLKNQIKNKILGKIYSKLSFNWSGSNNEWKRHKTLTFLLAGIATPLVISVHSVVSMDFAVSIIPGWHSTIFPPYFVAGAILSGFAMVQLIALPVRKMMRLDSIITLKHIDNMNKIILLTGSIVLVSYLTEIFYAYNGHFQYEWREIVHRFTGKYAFAFYLMLIGNALLPQLLWFKKIRLNLIVTFLLSMIIVISMWFERYIIVVSSLSGGYIEGAYFDYKPTITDIGLLAGSVGFFFCGLLLFIRYFPVVPVTELIKEDKDEK